MPLVNGNQIVFHHVIFKCCEVSVSDVIIYSIFHVKKR
jgi:hypothetical protein